VEYTGSLDTTVTFDAVKLKEALHDVRQVYFRHHALYRGLNGDHFGEMLRKLVNDRCGNYEQFATDLGISLSYVHNLMDEPFAVSNPSARLLKRMSRILGVPVGYLLGESEESDAEWVESTATWRAWINNTPGLDAKMALEVRDQWRDEYRQSRRSEPTAVSFRKARNVMRESD
jgi:transcriptional regulator with XRE-family HTH domain